MKPEQRPTLCLWGFMGTGKSTVGRLVARARGARFVDLDAMIEVRVGKSIAAIFEQEGEQTFRLQERLMLHETLRDTEPDERLVVALGGGALLDPDSRTLALATAFVATLTADVPTIRERTRQTHHRPLLEDRQSDAKITQLLDERRALYALGHLQLDTVSLSAEEVATQLCKYWKAAPGR